MTPGGGRSLICTPRTPEPPTACSRGGCDWRASPHQRARTTHGPRLEAARDDEPEQYGGRAPRDQSIANDTCNVARSGRAEGRTGSVGASGGPVRGPPPPSPRQACPPAAGRSRRTGLPRDPDRTRTPGENAPVTKGGLGREPQAPPPRERAGGPQRDPPPCPRNPPQRPASHGGTVPHPPRGTGDDPSSPLQDRGAREGGRGRACPPAPAACSRRIHEEQANPRQYARAPQGPRPGTASEHEPERYGGHALHGQSDAKDTRFVACPGKAEGRTKARRPPAPPAPPSAQSGGTAHRLPPPPPPHPPALERPRRADPPGGERTAPSQVGGKRDRAAPFPSKPNGAQDRKQGTRRGTDRVERPYQRPAPGPREVSAGHAGREGGNGRDTTPGTGPRPPNRPRAPRTHDQGTALAKAVVAHRATHQPQG